MRKDIYFEGLASSTKAPENRDEFPPSEHAKSVAFNVEADGEVRRFCGKIIKNQEALKVLDAELNRVGFSIDQLSVIRDEEVVDVLGKLIKASDPKNNSVDDLERKKLRNKLQEIINKI